ncbi:membrane protein [Actinokineospora globicatena]|nr:membrane protein [Actinokineospora globicatena]GLW85272.1 membrane protein [Actinokineospora globicatena]
MSMRTKRLPAALVLLSAVPIIAGAARLTTLAAPVTAENARFAAAPVPIVLHIVGATVFSLLGAFQFSPGLRRSSWHRRAGRITLPCGLIAALSGLWMTIAYPDAPGDGQLLATFRLVFGTLMVVSLVQGYRAIRRRDLRAHRVWMIRGYAIGVAAGTQVVVTLPWVVVFGQPGGTTRALLLGAAWVINLGIAEWAGRRSGQSAPHRRTRTRQSLVDGQPRVSRMSARWAGRPSGRGRAVDDGPERAGSLG